jgi:hypothetical protein
MQSHHNGGKICQIVNRNKLSSEHQKWQMFYQILHNHI